MHSEMQHCNRRGVSSDYCHRKSYQFRHLEKGRWFVTFLKHLERILLNFSTQNEDISKLLGQNLKKYKYFM